MAQIFQPKTKLVFYASGIKHEIEDLYMDFEITLSSLSVPNQATIKVFNLAAPTRALFQERHQAIEFYTTYEGNDFTLIFDGATSSVSSKRQGPEWVTEINCEEGRKEYDTKIFSKSYAKGVLVETIMEDIAKVFGLPYKIDNIYLDKAKIISSETFFGKAKDCLNRICKEYDHNWSILHGVLEIRYNNDVFIAEPTAIVISPQTGLLESPTQVVRTEEEKKDPAEDKKKTKKAKKDEEEEDRKKIGVSCLCALHPGLKPGRLVRIKSLYGDADTDGVFLIDTVKFFGSNYSGQFEAEFQADIPILNQKYYQIAGRF